MKIPANSKTYTTRSSIFWFNEEGIVLSSPREDAPSQLSDEEIIERADQIFKLAGEKKVCVVLELPPKQSGPNRHQRLLLEKQFERVVNALAIVANSPVSKMIANIFFAIKPAVFPVKIFTDENEALQWLRQICKEKKKS